MWSGPRNISTALMRAWGSRPDTYVCDEPLYAHYLTQIDASRHPGYRETLAAHETDWRKVIETLVGPVPGGKAIFYQKHMAHHVLPEIDVAWIDQLRNSFLIRHPRNMLASLARFIPEPTVNDTGLPQQAALYDQLVRNGAAPPIIDAADVLDCPERMLKLLCDALNVPYYAEMLSWSPGPRPTDGAWGPFWYGEVYKTTGFTALTSTHRALPDRLTATFAECERIYSQLYANRLH
jgi:hypothetical protein